MKQNVIPAIVVSAACALLASNASASTTAEVQPKLIQQNSKKFAVTLGGSRVVYYEGNRSNNISVTNEQDYPILIQSRVLPDVGGEGGPASDNKNAVTGFIVTPPIFRLDGGQKSRINIVNAIGARDNSKETLNWLCVKGIPPKDSDVWGKPKKVNEDEYVLNVELSVDSCVKLIYRPSTLERDPSVIDFSKKVSWKVSGKHIIVSNESPYYLSFSHIKLNGYAVKLPVYLAPVSKVSLDIPGGVNINERGLVQWSLINDQGGQGVEYKQQLQSVNN